MTKAKVEGFEGMVEFDEMRYDNTYDVYAIAICDPETDQVISEERYTSEDDYRSALYNTEGRELMDEQEECGYVNVTCHGEGYECEATHHIAYVIDHEED